MKDEELLDRITQVRAKNNIHWMSILRIALKADPKATKEALGKVLILDLEVSRLMREMQHEDWSPRDLDKSSAVCDIGAKREP